MVTPIARPITGTSKCFEIKTVNTITTRLNTTGAIAGTPKFPKEFNMPIQSEVIRMNQRYGSIILNNIIVSPYLYENSTNPGAMILIITGAKKIPASIMSIPIKDKKQKKEKAIATAFERPSFSRVSEKTGTNEMLNIPSENSFLTRSNGLKAIKNASLWEDMPKYMAMSASLITPRMRLLKVKMLITTVFLNIFLTSFP